MHVYNYMGYNNIIQTPYIYIYIYIERERERERERGVFAIHHIKRCNVQNWALKPIRDIILATYISP